ncbi:MAG: POTRA domain-containing protein [Myxococcales bacterium]
MKLLFLVVALLSVPAQARIGDEPVPPWAQPEGGDPVRVGEVVFEGSEVKGLRALVALEDGAPLDPREVRDAVRALHGSARFGRVAAYIEPLPKEKYKPGWTRAVRLVFVLAPVQKLVSVAFRGQKALAESLLHQTANLQVNAEFEEDLVPRAAEAIQAAYHRIGYRRATVTPVRTPAKDGVALEMRIDEGPVTRIAEVRFTGDQALHRDELLAAFKLQPGDVLNLAFLDEGVRGVRDRYRRAGRLRAVVESPLLEDVPPAGARVIVPVRAGPVVRFHMRGNVAFPDGLLIAQLARSAPSGEEEPVDPQMAQEMAARLRRFYVAQGFLRARISEREIVARDGAVELVFSIDEDRPVRVEQIVFTGNQEFATTQLRERVLQQLRDGVVPDPAPGADPWAVDATQVAGRVAVSRRPRTRAEPETVFDPVLYARALKQIEDLYKSQGYLSARAGPPRPEAIPGDPHRLRVTIPIAEGEQTRVSRILVEGGGEVSPRELDAAITLRHGQPFNYLAAEEGRAALTQIFTRRGHLYARVEDEESFDENAEAGKEFALVQVRYRIQPGPVVRVGFVEVVGQRKTQESLVLDLIGLKQGDVLTPEVIDRGQQALLRTGIFFSATLTPRNPEVPEPEKTVQVQLRERPTKDFQATLGFSLADGPRTTVQWTQGNLLGRGLTFTAVAKADFPFLRYTQAVCPAVITPTTQCVSKFNPPSDPLERVVDLGISAPRLYPLTDKLRGGIDLIHVREVRPSYEQTKYSAQVSLELAKNRPLAAGLQYEVGFRSFAPFATVADYVADVDPRLFRQPAGDMLFGSLRPSVSLDLRDDPARPRSGLFAQVSADYLRSFEASSLLVRLVKLQAQVAGYVPLPLLSSLVLSARGGRIYQLNPNSHTPGDRSFYLGGATSLRGFHEDAVQPQDVVEELHRTVRDCQGTLSGGFGPACTPQARVALAGGPSSGGDEFVAFTAELRIPIARSLEIALFYDAGNLWLTPQRRFFSTLVLRDAVGFGLRWLTPVGRIAIDLGINLSPDELFAEPRVGPYFSLDPL